MALPLFAALFLAQAAAGDWPRFRGPGGDGVAPPDADPPVEWSETKHVAWKSALPGRGRSSPVLLGDRIFVTGAKERGVKRVKIGSDDMQTAEHVGLYAAALDRATGKILWETPLGDVDKPDPVHWLNSWATPTPAVEPGRLFIDFGGMATACLDPVDGKILWRKQIPLDHQVGPGSSLLVDGPRLVMVRDGRDAQYVAALDKTTGEIAWKTQRPPIQVGHPNLKKSFSSPVIVDAGGRRQIAAIGAHWVAGYDPATGRELWRLRHGDGFSIGTVPVFVDGLLVAGTGCFRPTLVAVKVDGTGDVTSTHLAWRSSKGIPVMSSPVLAGDALFWASDEGIASCAEAKTGTPRWQERLGEGHLASPIAAAGRVYFFGKEGKTTIVKTGPAYEKLGEGKVDGTVIATPAVSGKALFLRTDSHLYRLESR